MMVEENIGNEINSDLVSNTEMNRDNIQSIYVGNVPWKATQDEIKMLIATSTNTEVSDVRIIKEKGTGRSRGFAFVDIIHKDPEQFIAQAPQLVLQGRVLTVKHANPKKLNEENGDLALPE